MQEINTSPNPAAPTHANNCIVSVTIFADYPVSFLIKGSFTLSSFAIALTSARS